MKYLKSFNESINEIECIINKIKLLIMEEEDCSWEHFIDNQELGNCQSIVSGIKRFNIDGVVAKFGEIEVIDYTEEEYENKVMTHHWVEYNGEVLEFSKGTLKDFVDWNDEYSIEDGGEVNYNYNEINMK